MIVRKLAEIIRVRLYGGQPSDDAPITLRQVAIEIVAEAAQAAKENFYENANVEGYNYVNDSYTTRFTGVTVLTDNTTGLKYCTLPAPVVGVPKDRGLVNVYGGFGFSNSFFKIAAKDVSTYTNEPTIPKSILYWLEGGKIYFYPCGLTVPSVVVVTQIGQLGDLSEELNVPAEALKLIEDRVVAKLTPMANTPQDNTNDNISIRDRQ